MHLFRRPLGRTPRLAYYAAEVTTSIVLVLVLALALVGVLD